MATVEEQPYLEPVPVKLDEPYQTGHERGAIPCRDPCPRCGVRGDLGCAHREANDLIPRLRI